MSDTTMRAKALLEGITPGRWRTFPSGAWLGAHVVESTEYVVCSDTKRENAEFIAAAPIRWELVRELVTENEQLQAQLEIRVRAALLLAHQLAEAAQVNQSLQPVRVTTVEELDALPADSVVMTISSRITYQRARTPRGDWYSSALSVCRTNVIGLPALVLWTPPDHITEQLQEVTRA